MGMDIKVFRMNRLGIPQDRMAVRLEMKQKTVHNHLVKMAALPKLLNNDLSRGFTVSQVAQKHGWTDPMVWALALEGKEDQDRFKELGWGLRTWDQWDFNDCDKRFGEDWPEAKLYCMGVLKGIYKYEHESDSEFKDWAVDLPGECFHDLLDKWTKRSKMKSDIKEMNEFVMMECDNWMK